MSLPDHGLANNCFQNKPFISLANQSNRNKTVGIRKHIRILGNEADRSHSVKPVSDKHSYCNKKK